MNIAIIDDSIEDARQLSSYIYTYFSEICVVQKTTIFNTAEEFLSEWSPGEYQLALVDIYLGEEAAGIRVAETIRQEDRRCNIIFTTSSQDFALKGFELHISDYLVKPIPYEKFKNAMDYICKSLETHAAYIEVKESRLMVKILLDDIYYTDYYNHYIQIHTKQRMYRTYMRFDEFSAILLRHPQFLCCYRNCIINMDKVTSLDKSEVELCSGERLPIMRNQKAQIHQQYADYQFSRLNGG